MSVPKRVTKIKRDGSFELNYMSACELVQYTIEELTRGALRDCGMFLAKQYRLKIYTLVPKRSGKITKGASYWARRKEKDLQFGIGRRGIGFWAGFFEVGNETHPKLDLLRKTVLENVDNLEKIQGQYLRRLNNDNPSLSDIPKGDEIGE